MKLSLQQLRQISFGAVDTHQEGDFYHMLRMSRTQVDAFGAQDPVFAQRALATTGCRLDFWTDSAHIMVHTGQEGNYEILVNGLCACVMQSNSRCTLDLPQGENRVTILLAEHDPGSLKIVYLDEGASLRPHEYDRKLLFLGDSITQGHASSRPSTSYVNQVSLFLNAQVMNWGVGGSYFDPSTTAPVAFDPDAVFIAYGTNDYTHWQSRDDFEQACKAYMDRVKTLFPDKPVFCISPIWRRDGQLIRHAGDHQQLCAYIASQAAAHGFKHIDGYSLVPHLSDYYADEYLHPNDLGFSIYAQNLVRQLSKYL